MSVEIFKDMLGAQLKRVERIYGEEMIRFVSTDGRAWRMFHSQDCCETVEIEDICGDLDDLTYHPITMAEVVSYTGAPGDGTPEEFKRDEESYTWTFYKFATIKGSVTIRWYGSSNGYYSESVTFELEGQDKEQD